MNEGPHAGVESAVAGSLQDRGLEALGRVLDRAVTFLLRIPAPWFIAAVVCWSVLRAGVGLYGPGHTADTAATLPNPYDYTSSGLLAPVLYRVLGLGYWTWMGLSTLFVAAAAVVPVVFVARRSADPRAWRLAALLFACGQALASSLQLTGHYQSVLILALTMSVVVQSRPWAVLWVVTAAFSGPEQALLAYLALGLAAFARPLRPWRFTATVGIAITAVGVVTSGFWLNVNDVPGRAQGLVQHVSDGLQANAVQGLLGVYSWWGPWWVLVLLVVLATPRGQRLILLAGAVLVPRR